MTYYRLINENQTNLIFSITPSTWYSLLDLADAYGWNPMGAIPQVELFESGKNPPGYDTFVAGASSDGFAYQAGQSIQLEDALNLADALERAFRDYEPRRLPSLTLLNLVMEPGMPHFSRPSIGAILHLIEFCRCGAFWIEANDWY